MARVDKPTARQQEILDYALEFMAKYGEPPTVRDYVDYFEFAGTNSVVCHLKALQYKWLIVHRDGGAWVPRYRTIECECPHCGGGVAITEEYEE